jgi:hypothetical protein
MTISGAAADPNMSLKQSITQTALMTVLNLRLGWWIENPNVGPNWCGREPTFGTLLLREFVGLTNESYKYVHLSDGGHFENLGAYELIRRRCRFIVAIDAAEDPDDASENLANLVRLCRIDFGVLIDIDTSPLRKDEHGKSRTHVAIGSIRYDEADPDSVAGTFVFIRSSLTGDEPTDLINYSREDPRFPHHSTADQFFDERQFESYRALGYHIARTVFGEDGLNAYPLEDEVLAAQPAGVGRDYQQRVRQFFAELRDRWQTATPGLATTYVEGTQNIDNILESLGKGDDFSRLNRDLYPELEAMGLIPKEGTEQFAEFRMIDRMLAVMEQYWSGAKLDKEHALPTNRGWMNTFRRWAQTEAFLNFWPILQSTYHRGFVRFCERSLSLPAFDQLITTFEKTRFENKYPPQLRAQMEQEFFRERAFLLMDFVPQTGVHKLPSVKEFDASGRHLQKEKRTIRHLGKALDQCIDGWYLGMLSPKTVLNADSQNSQSEIARYPCGVILLLSDGPDLELLVWIRGAFRSCGIGSDCLKTLMPVIRKKHFDSPGRNYDRLIVRLPECGTSAAERQQYLQWLNFFYDFNFRRKKPDKGDRFITLELKLPAASPKQ